jgi:hypothetical protein
MRPDSPFCSRRQFLRTAACGFGSVALAGLLSDLAAQGANASRTPLLTQLGSPAPHFRPRARRVIFLFMQGGPSQIDLFEHKPRLVKEHGKPIPFQRPRDEAEDGIEKSKLLAPVAKISRRGQSGMWWSDLLPNLGRQVDRICLLNGMVADNPAHPPAVMQVQTGYTTGPHPSMGSWISYGLGTENRNLPAFVTLSPILSGDGGGPHLFGSAYLPAIHQGMPVGLDGEGRPVIRYLTPQPPFPAREGGKGGLGHTRQREQLALIEAMNRDLQERAGVDDKLEGMIQSFELAFRMQSAVPGLFDLSRESKATQKLYGIGEGPSDGFGKRCLLARRLVESGVRFVQVSNAGWDHHQNIRSALPQVCASVDRPIAGLLADLHSRGLLEDTLVLWMGEFGRSPYDQDISLGKDGYETFGRGHNPYGFTAWLAGGGVRGGLTHGATDEYGYRAIEGKVHIHDLHATILHLLGLDHEKLTYRHAGRDFRLTDVYGNVVKEILS